MVSLEYSVGSVDIEPARAASVWLLPSLNFYLFISHNESTNHRTMKFKARLSREGIGLLHGLVTNMSKFSDVGTVFMDRDHVRLSVAGAGGPAGGGVTGGVGGGIGGVSKVDNVNGYVEITAKDLFVDYRIESNVENDVIIFEINFTFLSKGLASGKSSNHTCILKLVKRFDNKPHLSIDYPANSSILVHGRVDICHDIPIKLIKVDIVGDGNGLALDSFFPPQIRTPDVCIELVSKIKLLKTVIERLGKFGKIATLSVDGQGKFYVETSNNMVKIKTIVSGLGVSLMEESDENDEESIVRRERQLETVDISAKVNVKKLSLLLDFAHTMQFEACSLCKFSSIFAEFITRIIHDYLLSLLQILPRMKRSYSM